ncbi:hypothetical protein O6H91_23G054800 [Diphasiastrum complanatum]|uniref:Uncharacterized protein n=2 Tax=Diphasiastrum complanatum TaxID=34168 RepID=A0ACC2ACQ3_DIPCM|nr:hypothetical protein O6H91_Y342600 [Diphasiastrum complanatum]KAJ7298967.1 hypothetical protein O6H91_Y342600 [Diphasiastrum complanatum]KAJ7514674.1 hypothetical protein O6H91_23G054800 [Diphasiastrum complanatum]KAJ7514675.1 hypothetical protein O6H91_23G054800 [Diphasiastrum complanatum]
MEALCAISTAAQRNNYLLVRLIVVSIAVFCVASTTKGQQHTPTPYQMLDLNGFPAGLLPNTVVSSTFDSNGRFVVRLSEKCLLNIPGAYPVTYDTTITGIISPGRLSSLSGITVKVFFVWWSITEIYVSGSNLVFVVGFASASYPASNFLDSPICSNSMISAV